MTENSTTERLLFPELFAKPVVMEFDQRQGSSDGGAVLLKAAEKRYGLIAGMSGCLRDPRQAGKIDHSLPDLFAQRVFSIACGYAAGTWERARRVIIKAEVVRAEDKAPKDNPRFVVTNMKQTPQWLYEEVYCQRGEIENRIKELHAMEIDRTSCTRFWANQFRVLMTAAAYVLMQELRLSATGTNCARAQVWTLRERFLKLGARVVATVRRMVIHLPQSFPFLPTFRHIAMELGASPG